MTSRRAAVAVIAIVVAACARTSLPVVSPAALGRAQQRWADTSAEQLADGRDLYRAKCSGCHRPIAPGARTSEEWPGILDEMSERAPLTAAQRVALERYLVAIASDRDSDR